MKFNKAGAIAVFTGVASLGFAQNANKIVHYVYPPGTVLYGAPREKNIDCGTLYRPPSNPKKAFITCAFAKQADSNSQNICTETDNMPFDEKGQLMQTSIATAKALEHFAVIHKNCRKLAGNLFVNLKMRQGLTQDQATEEATTKYGQGWQQATLCPLYDIFKMCQAPDSAANDSENDPERKIFLAQWNLDRSSPSQNAP